jgi:hypothetical protein
VNLKRRAFLHQLALALGALGVSGAGMFAGPAQYQQALARPARRKLALLIGINRYPERAIDSVLVQDSALKGCITDLELQRQLLQYRFGFQSADILTLKNQEATRAAILEAIDQHLIQQAKGDDLVVLHFSGYGSQVNIDSTPGTTATAWVTVDSRLPTEENPTIADLLEVEVADRLKQLSTQNVVTIVDAGSQDVGSLRWGNLKLRSRPTAPTGNLSPELPPKILTQLDNPAPWPGLLLRAGETGHLVLESQWQGFSAGVFTYALTQVLWETMQNPDPKTLVRRTEASLQQWTGPDQVPVLQGILAEKGGLSAYIATPQAPPADGVILPGTDPQRPLNLWLGGMPATVLQHLQPGSRFFTVPTGTERVLPTNANACELRLESRSGLRAIAKPTSEGLTLAATRQPIYEKVRLIPHDIDLVVALDGQLERVERVDATSALAGIPFVTSTQAGEQPADCLFGRLPTGLSTTLTAALPSAQRPGAMAKASDAKAVESSYGLFAPNRTLIPGTLLARDEAVKTAVNRLMPHLQTLLAMKLVRLTQNRLSSWLGASAVLEITQPKAVPLIWQETERPGAKGASSPSLGAKLSAKSSADTVHLTTDNRILYRVANRTDRPLYFTLISFDSRGECNAFIAPNEVSPEADTVEQTIPHAAVGPGQTRLLPDDGSDWGVPSTVAWVETHVVLSSVPLTGYVKVLQQEGKENPLQSELRRINQPLRLAQALLQDLSTAAHQDNSQSMPGNSYALHQEHWVTFSFRYPVI